MVIANRIPLRSRDDSPDLWKIRIGETLDKYGRDTVAILPCLEIIQEASGYITPKSVKYLAEALNLPAARIYSVASFYGMLTTRKQGKYVVRLCNSLVCDVNSSYSVLQTVESELGIKSGETTPDNNFTLEVVPCLGLCDKAPAMMVNDKIYGFLTEEKVKKIFLDLMEDVD
jgi:NADH-quinone oxidoreductase E subunit